MPRRLQTSGRRPLTVLYADRRWVAINKPAGVSVHGGARAGGPSVLERLKSEIGEDLHLVHRLDRSTAGVLLLAREAETAKAGGLRWNEVRKAYWALVKGRPAAPQVIRRRLRDPDGRSRDAETELQAVVPLGAFDASLCRIEIRTGRRHQIRRHLEGIGHPVLMDDKYGDFAANRAFAGAAAELGQPKPKHAFLLCRRLLLPAGLGAPELLAPWPSSWPPLLHEFGVSVDDVNLLA